jgi:hypothetical protein
MLKNLELIGLMREDVGFCEKRKRYGPYRWRSRYFMCSELLREVWNGFASVNECRFFRADMNFSEANHTRALFHLAAILNSQYESDLPSVATGRAKINMIKLWMWDRIENGECLRLAHTSRFGSGMRAPIKNHSQYYVVFSALLSILSLTSPG